MGDEESAAACLRACSSLVKRIETCSGLVPQQVLTVIGCEAQPKSKFDLGHLRNATRFLQDLATLTQDLYDLTDGDPSKVSEAFLHPDSRTRSRRDYQSWHQLYVDIFTRVANATAPKFLEPDSEEVRAAIAEIAAWADEPCDRVD